MKCVVIAFLAVAVAVSHAGIITSPALIAPAGLIASPYAISPLAVAPQVLTVSAIQPGYVAATRGSVHIAPLPGNTPLASHHLNLAPAPGTI